MNDAELKPADTEENNWGMFAHLSALVGLIIPFGSVIAPFIIWLTKGKESTYVGEQAKEALNFQITAAIAFLISFMLMFVVVGFLLMAIVGIADVVLVIIASIAASKGEMYRYPFALRLVK